MKAAINSKNKGVTGRFKLNNIDTNKTKISITQTANQATFQFIFPFIKTTYKLLYKQEVKNFF